ncbi:MAG TPA: GNAT family N-acetyltransferase [Polyangiales bacterium]|nr:GNAT family N-acetyltransferase [Polyangiales bacterium]
MRYWSRTRARILVALPPELRGALRATRSALQRIESRVRKGLPQRLGGRLAPDALQCRLATDADAPEFHALREIRRLCGENFFVLGVWHARELIACGTCVSVGPSDAAPFEHVLFAADYVAPHFRRRGVASNLHRARIDAAARRGTRIAYAWVSESNPASRGALAAASFVQVPQARRPAWLNPPAPAHLLLEHRIA